jgi:putative ABC transport system permease protein
VRIGGWLSAARLARRELLAHRWRTVLLATLVALPLAGVTLAVVAIRSTTWTQADARTALLGGADDVVDLDDSADPAWFRREVAAAYPDEARVVVYSAAPDGVEGSDGHLHGVEVTDQPLDDPLFEGTIELVDGRPPRTPGEVAATQAVLASADADLGDELTLVSGKATVTGELKDPADSDRMLVVAPTVPSHALGSLHAVIDAPEGFVSADKDRLDRIGAWSAAPIGAAFDHLDGDFRYRLLRTGVAGGVILAIATIVASAGFAIGARQQLRTLGLLAASGVPPRALHAVVLLQGALTGLIGAFAGVGLGVVGAHWQAGLVESLSGRTPHGLDVRPLDLLALGAWGFLVPTLAALLPARFAARVSVLAALADRRPQGRLPRRIPMAGILVDAAGLVALAVWTRHQQSGWGYGLTASLAVLFGGLLLSPWIVVQTERLAWRSHGPARFAVRDFARQRLRSSAAVAAIAAPASLSVVAGALDRTDEVRHAHESYEEAVRADEVLLAGHGDLASYGPLLDDALPGSVVITVDGTSDELTLGDERRTIVVVAPDDLARLGAPRRTIEALTDGRAVLFSPVSGGTAGSDVLVDLATHVPRGRGIAAVSPEEADRRGLTPEPYALVVRAAEPLTAGQREAVDALVTTRCDSPLEPTCDDEDLRATLLGRPTDPVWLEIGRDHDRTDRSPAPLDAVGLSLVFMVAVTWSVLMLTTTMDAPQRTLLDAVGAPPTARRTIAMWHVLLLTLSAMALAVPGGLAVADVIVSKPHATGIGLQPPWPLLAILVLVVPAGGAAVVWIATTLTSRGRGRSSDPAAAPPPFGE